MLGQWQTSLTSRQISLVSGRRDVDLARDSSRHANFSIGHFFAGPILAFAQTIHMSASFLSPIVAGLITQKSVSEGYYSILIQMVRLVESQMNIFTISLACVRESKISAAAVLWIWILVVFRVHLILKFANNTISIFGVHRFRQQNSIACGFRAQK